MVQVDRSHTGCSCAQSVRPAKLRLVTSAGNVHYRHTDFIVTCLAPDVDGEVNRVVVFLQDDDIRGSGCRIAILPKT